MDRNLVGVGAEYQTPVRVGPSAALQRLLPTERREREEPGADAADRRAIHRMAVLRLAQDQGTPEGRRLGRESQASQSTDAPDGHRGHLPETTDDEINARWQQDDASLLLAQARERAYAAYQRRLSAIRSAADVDWDNALRATAHADGYRHYESHRRYIESAGSEGG